MLRQEEMRRYPSKETSRRRRFNSKDLSEFNLKKVLGIIFYFYSPVASFYGQIEKCFSLLKHNIRFPEFTLFKICRAKIQHLIYIPA